MTTGPITQLTPAEKRIAQHLIKGITTADISTQMHLSPHTVKSHIRVLRGKLQCPPRCSLTVLVQALMSSRQVDPPTSLGPAPDLNSQQLRLLRAVAHHSGAYDIARAAKIVPADVRADVEALVAAAGAANPAHMVALAHAWSLLGQNQEAARAGGTR
ncbi:response regulator transcription factor [Streptomyces sp. NPDC003247]|uniref:response regulator transcription factor n=1 Tax=Streptomyces sp. NPDC003247 TaxID=3364677 RepID=UPI0036C87246